MFFAWLVFVFPRLCAGMPIWTDAQADVNTDRSVSYTPARRPLGLKPSEYFQWITDIYQLLVEMSSAASGGWQHKNDTSAD